jgi:hypothetical protein
MARPRRYAAYGALGGASLGALAAAVLAFGTGAYALEVMALFIAPPFGWLLAYPIGAATGFGPVGRVLWAVLTSTANWALVGLLVGTVQEIRVRNREMRRRMTSGVPQ